VFAIDGVLAARFYAPGLVAKPSHG
jgi:hypothetical protein